MAAILLFVVSSAVCGLAPNLPMLLAARIVQGAVAGPLVPLSQSLLLASFPRGKSSSALSLWAMTATAGPIAGPALGGWITDNYNWSWIFYINVPVGLFAVLLAPLMSKIMPKSDMRVLVTLAFLGFAGVFLMRSWYTTGIDAYTLVPPTLLRGIPMALFFTPLTAIILSGLPPEKIPAAAGLSNFARILADAAGTSLMSTIWNDRTIQHHAQLTEQTSVNNPAYMHALANIQMTLHASVFKAQAFFETQLSAQASMLGLNDVFWLSAVIFVLIIPLIWIAKPSKDGAKNAAGADGH